MPFIPCVDMELFWYHEKWMCIWIPHILYELYHRGGCVWDLEILRKGRELVWTVAFRRSFSFISSSGDEEFFLWYSLSKSDSCHLAPRIMFSMSIDRSNEGIIFNAWSHISCILPYWCNIIWRFLIYLPYLYSRFSATAVQPAVCLLCRRIATASHIM